jgi:hypothetical protein
MNQIKRRPMREIGCGAVPENIFREIKGPLACYLSVKDIRWPVLDPGQQPWRTQQDMDSECQSSEYPVSFAIAVQAPRNAPSRSPKRRFIIDSFVEAETSTWALLRAVEEQSNSGARQ